MRRLLFLSILVACPLLHAAETIPYELKNVGITEHLGKTIDLNLKFKDDTGKTVVLKDYFGGKKPVILTLAYYGCPNLCGLLMNGVADSFKDLKWAPGQEFEYVNVSIDPTETPTLAAEKKANYIKMSGRPQTADGWHFLVGDDKTIHALAQQVGYAYYYDKDEQQYAHGSAIFVLTPDGTLSRYLFGVTFEPRDMRLALLEASSGKIGNIVDHILLYCYRYDPKSRKYSLLATRMMKVAAGATLFGVVAGIMVLRKRHNV
ncbi:MAG: hypothetical protein COV45_02030 [Deltaproteobacteria bacterium CG11_big_fil_rev_8_21_14_0_20_47_16]|nr:MAG: hypothetical protein COV45_02030 [Deltaproteobacteria bacterium CG11_big_fil_rev_8_21_14_0_20_47_16]